MRKLFFILIVAFNISCSVVTTNVEQNVSFRLDSINVDSLVAGENDSVIYICNGINNPVYELEWVKNKIKELNDNKKDFSFCVTHVIVSAPFMLDGGSYETTDKEFIAYEFIVAESNPDARDSEMAFLYDCDGNLVASYSFAWSVYKVINRKILYNSNQ